MTQIKRLITFDGRLTLEGWSIYIFVLDLLITENFSKNHW